MGIEKVFVHVMDHRGYKGDTDPHTFHKPILWFEARKTELLCHLGLFSTLSTTSTTTTTYLYFSDLDREQMISYHGCPHVGRQ